MPFGGVRRLDVEKRDDGLRIDLLLPHHRLGADAQCRDARPARIGGDECGITRKVVRAVFAAQDHPFHELAGERIGHGALDVGGFVLAVLAHEIDGLLHRSEVHRRGRRTRRGNEGWGGRRRPRQYRRRYCRRLDRGACGHRRNGNRARRRCGRRGDRKRGGPGCFLRGRFGRRVLAGFVGFDRRPVPRQWNRLRRRRGMRAGRQDGDGGAQHNEAKSRHDPSRWVCRSKLPRLSSAG